MNRYHKKIYFPSDSNKKLNTFTDLINNKKWLYSRHSIDNLKYRAYNINDILNYIKQYQFNAEQIFEYYSSDTGHILKVCYRINYSDNIDLILVIGYNKELITIYANITGDNHITLNRGLYTRG